MNQTKTLYRYVADVDYGRDFFRSQCIKLKLIKYTVQRYTPKGYVINIHPRETKWVSATHKKRFAYPTKHDAFINLLKRTEKRKLILTTQLEDTNAKLDEIIKQSKDNNYDKID